jgi:hypothetical protein
MMRRGSFTVGVWGVVALWASAAACADPAPFDLVGPTIEVEVTRDTATLPVSGVPNLAAGDRVWMKPALSSSQAAHYLMVVAFLRGSTDPPPWDWFFRCDTWAGRCSREGMTLTVPREARQVLVFLAPATGGDFRTLVNAVRGRPGVFVRTSQELNQAALEHQRLEAYLAAVRRLGEGDPARLKEAAPLLARSLAIKVDEKCLDRIPALQAPCLMQGRESLIMTDGQSASLAQELTSGPASDLAMEAVNTPQLKSGYYGPFIGSILDVARLFDSFHTAHYQYIPALASAEGRELKLMLNAPPSFHDPKSVLVATLPAVGPALFPPLRAVDPKETFCARQDPLILPVEGAPLVFTSAYAHTMTLKVPAKGGATIALAASADPSRGGFAIDTSGLSDAALDGSVRASLEGEWGFDKYQGPSFQLVDAREQVWELAAGDAAALIVGREDSLRLHGGDAKCVEEVALRDAAGKTVKVEWKGAKADEVDLKVSLQEASPGAMTLLIRRYGAGESQRLVLHAYAEVGHLESFVLHVGDHQGILRGERLDEVDKLALKDVEFVPGALSSNDGHDELSMLALETKGAVSFRPGQTTQAQVALKDGRTLDVKASIEPPRPSATLIGKSAQLAPGSPGAKISLASPDELPRDSILTFSLRAQSPAVFAHDEKIEVATIDGSSSTSLDVANGALTLQNAKVAVATLDPAKALGTSAFGPLRYRRIVNGVMGDWHPLATLVRLPALTGLRCPQASATGCTVVGTGLFLLDSVSNDSHFGQPREVPDGFTAGELPVPPPVEGRLYVKLRDDPGVISVATFKVPGATSSSEAVAAAKPDDTAAANTQATPVAASGGAHAPTVVSPNVSESLPNPSQPGASAAPPLQTDAPGAASPEARGPPPGDPGAGHSL